MINSVWARDERLVVIAIPVCAALSILSNTLICFGIPFIPVRYILNATSGTLIILTALYAVIRYQGERKPLVLLLIAAVVYALEETLSLPALNSLGLRLTGLRQVEFDRAVRSTLLDVSLCLAILVLVLLFITASRRTAEVQDRERRLGRSESKYRQLVELTPNWVFRMDSAGSLTFTNSAGATLLGYSPDEMIGRPLQEFLPADERPRVQALLEEVRTGRRASGVEFPCIGRDGRTRWVSFHLTPTSEDDSMFGVHGDGHDVTARKQAEDALRSAYDELEQRVQARTAELTAAKESLEREIVERRQVGMALRESEAVVQALLNAPTDSVILLDAESTILNVNETATQRVGRSAKELIGLRASDMLPPDAAQRRKSWLDHVFQSGQPCRFEDQHGDAWFDYVLFPVFDSGGRVAKVAVNARDITEQKQVEQTLRESEAVARALLNAPTDSILLLDAKLTVLDLNQTAAQRLGRPAEQLIGLHTTDLLPADVAQRRNAYLNQVFQTGAPCRFEDQNAGIWYDIVHFPVRDESGQVTKVAIVGRDITDRKRSEQVLRESEAVARALLNAPTDSVLLLDAESRILNLNETAAQRFGRPVEQLIGLRANDLLPSDVAQRRQDSLDRVLHSGQPCRFEDQRGDNWFDHVVFPILEASGGARKVAVIARDITEQKRKEQALRESEAKFRVLAETAPAAIFIHRGGPLLFVNSAMEVMTGYSREELLGMEFWSFAHPDFHASVQDRAAARLRGEGVVTRYEARIVTKSGESRWVDVGADRIEFDGQPAVIAMLYDITERKESQQKLQEANSELRAIFQAFPDLFFRMASDGTILDYHAEVSQELYVPPETFLGKRMQDVLPPDVGQRILTAIQQVFAGVVPASIEYALPMPAGECWYDARLVAFGENQVIVVVRNITKRKRAEELLRQAHDKLEHRVAERTAELSEANGNLRAEIAEREKAEQALRASEEKFRIKYRNSPVPTFSWQKTGEDFILVDHNNAAVEYTRGQVPSFLGRTDAQMYADNPQIREDLRRCFAEKAVLRREMVYRFQASPETRDLVATYVPIPPDLVMVHTDDITERKRAQEAVRKREQLYRDALQVAGAVPYYKKYSEAYSSDTYEFVGDEIRTFTGYGPEELTPALWTSMTQEVQMLGVLKNLPPDEALKRVRGEMGVNWQADYRIRTRSGEEKWLANAAVQVHDERGILVGSLGILQDITERRRAEDQARKHLEEMAHVQRVSTMGQMASELAHELNQPLGAVVNYTRGCVRRMQAGNWNTDELLEVMEDAASEALRAGRIVGSIMGFLKKKEMHRSRVSVNDIVQEAVELAKIDAQRTGVAIRLALDAQQPMTTADAIQIEQVVLNLVRNAIEAMSATEPRRRSVVIQTSLDPQETVLVTVRDTGPGLPPEAVGKVFDAFFTTKPDGLGVGLSISRSIVEAHEGRLWVESNEDGGCTFKFTLPGMRPG